MVVTRYVLAAELAAGKRVLEVGVAGGMGNQLLAKRARNFVGGDINASLLKQASDAMPDAALVRFDAQSLPFAAQSFDLVVCMECLYYMPDAESALSEISRVLAPGGTVLIVNANPERPDFIRSPFSHTYHSPASLSASLRSLGLNPKVWGGFAQVTAHQNPARAIPSAALRTIRKVLDRLGLVPRTLEARARMKRLLYWRLSSLPSLLSETTAPTSALAPLNEANAPAFKVFYCIATAPGAPVAELPHRFVADPAEFGGDEVRYVLLRRPRSAVPPEAALPPGYAIEVWTQSAFSIWPPGVERVWQYPAQFFMYLDSDLPLRAVLVRHTDTGQVVHVSLVQPRSFRYPFMSPDDLQIGGLWTMPAHRSRGLATCGVAAALELAAGAGGSCWYVVAEQNAVSIRLAERLGFVTSGYAQRRSPLGIRLLRRFEYEPLHAIDS